MLAYESLYEARVIKWLCIKSLVNHGSVSRKGQPLMLANLRMIGRRQSAGHYFHPGGHNSDQGRSSATRQRGSRRHHAYFERSAKRLAW